MTISDSKKYPAVSWNYFIHVYHALFSFVILDFGVYCKMYIISQMFHLMYMHLHVFLQIYHFCFFLGFLFAWISYLF